MSDPRHTTAQGGMQRRRWTTAVALALSVAGVVWGGCSVEKHYKVLSFFFDGVPDPALIAAGRSEIERVRAAGGTIYAHEPYAKEQCDRCHRTATGRMQMQLTSVVCAKCHAGVSEQHRYMHGPVAVAACLYCHSPHESTTKALLRTSANELCRQCHGSSFAATSKTPNPAHADPDRLCIDCHSGHGGHARYFLHDTYTAAPPPNPTPTPPQALPPPRPDEPDASPQTEGGGGDP